MLNKTRKYTFSVLNHLVHTHSLAFLHSASSQLCIDMIQIEHLSTAQVTHIHATALYKDHYIKTALTIRNTTETSTHQTNKPC